MSGVRVLGIDPGTSCTGWGVVEPNGGRVRGVAAGVLKTRTDDTLHARLKTVYDGIVAVIAEHSPQAIAVEDIFYARYANAALKLGHVRGVALLAAANAGIDVFAFPPAVVKRAIAGRGGADKEQVARIVGAILGWRELPSVDATDALAVAIAQVQASRSVLSRRA